MKELIAIQTELEAPKNQYNSFGKYNYRNAEDILGALKPLLKEHDCFINIQSGVTVIGDRYYREVTVTLTNSEGVAVSATASAMEAEQKKGMDAAQVSGAAESYAKKYALGNLFAIDDTKDADSMDNSKGSSSAVRPKQNDAKNELDQFIALVSKCAGVTGMTPQDVMSIYGLNSSKEFLNLSPSEKRGIAHKLTELMGEI